MKRLLVISDSHGDNDNILKWIEKHKIDAILHCGDIETFVNFPVPFIFIRGNHEDQEFISQLYTPESKNKYPQVTHLKVGDVKTLWGIRIAGIGGNYAPTRFLLDRKTNPSRFGQDRRRHYNHEDFKKASKLYNIDIFLTHEACEALGIICQKGWNKGNNAGRSEIDEVLNEIKPTFHFSGHHHYSRETKTDILHCISLPRPMVGGYIIDVNEEYGIVDSFFQPWVD